MTIRAGARRGGKSGVLPVLGLALVSAVTSACVDLFLGTEPDPNPDPVAVFDAAWTVVDRYFANFETKNVDWEAQRTAYRPRVTPTTSPQLLFQILSEMLAELRDGHVALHSPFATYTYTGWRDGFPENFDQDLAFQQLEGTVQWTHSHRIAYGRLPGDVGYIYVPTLAPGSWGYEIDDAISALDGVGALVLDLRGNGGGTDLIGEAIMARLVDRERVYRYYRYRNGPGHDDFTDLIADHIQPAGHHFGGPVALLTSRTTYSAAEDIVVGLRTLDRVVVVGDSTGGGNGNPIPRELPNGWTVQVSRWQVFDTDRRLIPDGVGLAPDVLAALLPEDVDNGRDSIVLAALAALAGR